MDSAKYIYILMAILIILALFNPAKGVARLFITAYELRCAAKKLKTASGQQILDGQTGDAQALFLTGYLRNQMRLYCTDAAQMDPQDNRQCTITDYFHDDLLDRMGNTRICEYISTGLTALGILGTFIGLRSGIGQFDMDTANAITASITTLINGIQIAFLTSIYGIGLSLALGFVSRIGRSLADDALDDFTDTFQDSVLGKEHTSAFSKDPKYSSCTEQEQILYNIAVQIADRMASHMKAQSDALRDALAETTTQQRNYTTALQTVIQELEHVNNRIQTTGDVFREVVSEGQALNSSIASANTALTQGMAKISQMINTNNTIVTDQQANIQALRQSASALGNMIHDVTELARNSNTIVADCAKGCLDIARNSQHGYETQLEGIKEATKDLHKEMHDRGLTDLEYLRAAALEIIEDMPCAVDENSKLSILIEQNNEMLMNQEQLIDILKKSTKSSVSSAPRRK